MTQGSSHPQHSCLLELHAAERHIGATREVIVGRALWATPMQCPG